MTNARTENASYYIAIPADPAGDGIYGIGTSAAAAWADAWNGANAGVPTIEHLPGILNAKERSWQIVNPLNGVIRECWTEDGAKEALLETGFRAVPCTERLYAKVEIEGYDANHPDYRYEKRADGTYDLAQRYWDGGVYDGDRLCAADETLPDTFTVHDGQGGMVRYTYTGPHSYDVHEWDDRAEAWVGTGSAHIDDDTTVIEFVESRED